MTDVNLGRYRLVAAPDGGADWQLKFGLSLFFPYCKFFATEIVFSIKPSTA